MKNEAQSVISTNHFNYAFNSKKGDNVYRILDVGFKVTIYLVRITTRVTIVSSKQQLSIILGEYGSLFIHLTHTVSMATAFQAEKNKTRLYRTVSTRSTGSFSVDLFSAIDPFKLLPDA